MQDIALDIGNNAQKILPVPYPRNPTPSVESPINYGSLPYPMALKSDSRIKDDLQYCNFLEPSPRNQSLNVPYQGNKDCPKFNTQPYDKDSCYLMDNKSQGVVGIVCNQPGGSDNANFVRGNQFGVDYPLDYYDKKMENKKTEYTVENPVQLPMELQNPMVIYDKNTFYPEPSFFLRKNKDFITYPLQQNYTENGLPTYTYPYKTLNPIFNDSTQDNDLQENFISNIYNENNKNKNNVFMLFVLIFILMFVLFFSR
jgi:hypothetical protein